jgi:hypothetical protein
MPTDNLSSSVALKRKIASQVFNTTNPKSVLSGGGATSQLVNLIATVTNGAVKDIRAEKKLGAVVVNVPDTGGDTGDDTGGEAVVPQYILDNSPGPLTIQNADGSSFVYDTTTNKIDLIVNENIYQYSMTVNVDVEGTQGTKYVRDDDNTQYIILSTLSTENMEILETTTLDSDFIQVGFNVGDLLTLDGGGGGGGTAYEYTDGSNNTFTITYNDIEDSFKLNGLSFDNSAGTIYKEFTNPNITVELSFNPDKATATEITIVSHVGVSYIDVNNLIGRTFS